MCTSTCVMYVDIIISKRAMYVKRDVFSVSMSWFQKEVSVLPLPLFLVCFPPNAHLAWAPESVEFAHDTHSNVCDITHSYVWRKSFKCVTLLIQRIMEHCLEAHHEFFQLSFGPEDSSFFFLVDNSETRVAFYVVWKIIRIVVVNSFCLHYFEVSCRVQSTIISRYNYIPRVFICLS